MNRSAPLQPQEAPQAIGTTEARLPATGPGLRFCGVAASIVGLALLGYIALWGATALELRRGVLEWIAARQAEGYRIAHSTIAIGGFPSAARVSVGEPVITAPDGRALGWSWAGDHAAIEANPLRRNTVTLRLGGEQAVSINVDGKLRTYRGGAEEVTFRTAGGPSPLASSLTIRNVMMATEEPGDVIEVERLSASGRAVERPAAAHPASAYRVKIDATGIRLPRQLSLPLGEVVDHLNADAIVGWTFVAKSDLPGALAGWRDGGGAVEFTQLSLRYGPLLLEGSGTAALDADLQPVGTFMARVQGFQQTISALAVRGLIDESTAARANVALAVLSRPGADAGPPTLSVPLSLHDRRLAVGPLPLLVVPMIEWPRGPSPRAGDRFPLVPGAPG